jgi:hypothetical protein
MPLCGGHICPSVNGSSKEVGLIISEFDIGDFH